MSQNNPSSLPQDDERRRLEEEYKQRLAAGRFIRTLLAGKSPPPMDELPDVGEWQEVCRVLNESALVGGVEAVRNSFTALARHDQRLITLVAASPQPSSDPRRGITFNFASLSPTDPAVGVQDETAAAEQITLGPVCPPLPEAARLQERAGVDASGWLDAYVAFSKRWSPQAYEGFHEAIGLWVLSTVAARRVTLTTGNLRYTPLFIALVAKTGLYAKSTTAEIGRDVLCAANLDWLLAADDTTPQKLVSDLAGRLPADYGDLKAAEQEQVRCQLALAGQRGWYYDEFGQLLSGMVREGSMADFRGILRRFDDCKSRYVYATISRGSERVENPYLALLASMTPADLKPMAQRGSSMWNDGFLSRFALVTPSPREFVSMPMPTERRVIPDTLITPLVRWHERLGLPKLTITLNEGKDKDKEKEKRRYRYERGPLPENCCEPGYGVLEAFVSYRAALLTFVSHSPQDRQDLDGSYVRFPEKALRIAMLLASLENAGRIEHRHWARAQEICERWRADLHTLFSLLSEAGPVESELLEEKVLRIVELLGLVTVREVKQRVRGADTMKIRGILDGLVQAGTLEAVGTGRTVRYRLSTG
jgi:Protein of unknown function (DUF3987)